VIAEAWNCSPYDVLHRWPLDLVDEAEAVLEARKRYRHRTETGE